MKTRLILFTFLLFLFNACGKKGVNYKEKLSGIWQISNVPEILKVAGENFTYNADALRNATLAFEENGNMIANISEKTQKGKWKVSEDGTLLTMNVEGIRFNETLHLEFENERTIVIKNNGKKFELKKIKD